MTGNRIAPCPGRAESFRRFVLETPFSAVLYDLDWRFLAISPGFEAWGGPKMRDFIGKSLFDASGDYSEMIAGVNETLASGRPNCVVTRQLRIERRGIWIRMQASYWHDDDGAVCGYLVLNQDVTAEHESELRRRQMEILLQAVVDNIPATVAVQDYETSEYLLVNKLIASKAGMTVDDMVGKKFAELFPDQVEKYAALERQFKEGMKENGISITEYELKDGSPAPPILRLKRVVYEDGRGHKRRLTIGEDVTDLRRATWALEGAVAEAKAANAAKSNFLANVSHEIRTPLNGVLGMAQAMARDSLTPRQRERLDVIRRSGESLVSLLNDLLDMSKIEAGKLQLESVEFDLGEIINGACAAFQVLAEQKGLEFDIRFDGTNGICRGDPTRVRQVVSNLVSNAVKFTAKGGITVSAVRDGAIVHLSIEDTGMGMAPETLDKLFGKFVQADASTTRRFGGTGLGLAICRDLVEMMGGRISVESVEGKGSRFTLALSLPRARDGETRVPGIAPAKESQRRLRILAAEDNAINQRVLQAFLEPAGHEPVFVENGIQAVEAWEREHWDVVLMDVQMPIMDGMAATAIIRKRETDEGRVRTPIVALTANAMAHQADEYLIKGMDAVVAKPIIAKALIDAIAQLTSAGDPESSVPLARSA